jgi:hypothetical protein
VENFMNQKAVYEVELLDYAISNASAIVAPNLDTRALQESMPVSLASEIIQQLAQVLDDQSFTALATRIAGQRAPAPASGYGLRLQADYKDGQPESMTFYRITDSWQSTALSLLGLAIALATHSHTGPIVPSAGIVLNSWKQLVRLRKPADALEIDTYEALTAALARLSMRTLSAKQPTALEVFDSRREGSVLSTIRDVIDGLKRLKQLSLVEVSSWGGNSGDDANESNRWQPKL